MPRRATLTLEDVASFASLSAAFWRAARRCRERDEVVRFSSELEKRLEMLRSDILGARAPVGRWTELAVFDPKPRRILAPCFEDRVMHHALMAGMGPVLDRALVADTYACRVGGGTLAAVRRAQQLTRRSEWFVKMDVKAYFASVDHAVMQRLLERRFKNPDLLSLCWRILTQTPCGPGRGLPIGALTSQHFANTYLDGLDRLLLERWRVRGMVRYMDDVVWWCDDAASARATLCEVRAYLGTERGLEVKANARIGRTAQGFSFLGFRVFPWLRRLSLRRRRRHAACRRRWEARYARGAVDALGLQRGYEAALAITAHADALRWRRAELARRVPLDA